MSLPFSKIRNVVLILSLLILSGGIGYRLGQKDYKIAVSKDQKVVVNQSPPSATSIDFALFWDIWQKLFRYHIDAATFDVRKMVDGAISGMVNAVGDPFTAYFPPKENQDFKDDLGGEFQGIGAQLGTKDNRIIVIAPLKGTPAERAGLRPSDWILKVNGEDTVNWTVATAVTKIRGPRGTSVLLTILHENETKPKDVSILRDIIVVPSVDWWIKEVSHITEISSATQSAAFRSLKDKIAYIRLSRFGDKTNDEWLAAVNALVSERRKDGAIRGLVFDLRNNPGGYLDGSVFIGSEFVKNGTIVSQINSDGTKEDFPVNRKGKLTDIPLTVLINKGSASAAEIVAGALRDLRQIKLVGENTFGKGSVQTPYELTGGAGVHITTGKWLLPSGASINKDGVKPDVEVTLTSTEASADAQLAKGIELLLQ